MVNRLSWCGVCLGCTWAVLAAEPQALRRMPLRIETQGTDPATRALLPGLVAAVREGLKADGIALEPTVDGAPTPEALRLRVSTSWNRDLEGMEIHLSGNSGRSSEPAVHPVFAQQTLIVRDRTAVPATLNEQALVLARFLVREPGTGGPSSIPVWAPSTASTIGLTLVDGKTMKMESPRPPLDYPWAARSQRIQGVVSMDLRVDGKGNVARISMVEGHPLLAETALKYVFQRRFQVPSDWNGLGYLNFQASLRFGLPAISKTSRAVLEVAPGETLDRGIQPDLAAVANKARTLLNEEGVDVLPTGDAADPELRRLRIVIESLHTPANISLYGVRANLSRFQAAVPSGPGEFVAGGMVVGQQGTEGLQESLDSTLEEVLRSVVDPPRPKRIGLLSDLPSKVDLDVVEFDFSQIKIKRQPPAPHYPTAARERRIQGTVVVELVVGADGRPIRGLVRTGPPELMLTALTYALDWTFEPARVNGVPVKCRFKLTMPFKLR